MDRRSFLKTSGLVGAAAAVAPKELLVGASASEIAYPVGNSCPKAISAFGTSASSLIQHLVFSGQYRPSEIAYVSKKKETMAALFRELPYEILIRDGHVPPYFSTLHSILYRKLIQGKDGGERLLGPGDMTMFLASMPDYHEAARKVSEYQEERMRCSSIQELRDPSIVKRRHAVTSYLIFKNAFQLVDKGDLLVRGLYPKAAVDGAKILIYHVGSPPLWHAALKNVFRKADQIIFLDEEK